MQKDGFGSKSGFLSASIGAAVGLGNALRFPGQCARYGGGAYMTAYFFALILLGIPLLNAEIALGRKLRASAPECMARLVRGGEKFGWTACFNSVLTAILYVGLAGWILSMAFSIVPLTLGVTKGKEIIGYFFDEVLKSGERFSLTRVSFAVLFAIGAAWFVAFLALSGGARTIERTARFTVFFPIALFSVLSVRGLLYENCGEALAALFVPTAGDLLSAEMWLSALGQVFFSLSLAVGIMPTFGSYLDGDANVFSLSLVIAAADFFVSALASVSLFTTLYGCGLQEAIGETGIITAFTVYPAAIAGLFGEARVLSAGVGVLFYLSLALMAVQAAVSMTEAFLSPLVARIKIPREKLAAAICVIGFFFGVFFATDGAVKIVEVVDRLVNFYIVLLLGIGESLILGASGRLDSLLDAVNEFGSKRLKMPRWLFEISIKFLTPAILILLLIREAAGLLL